MKLIGVSKTMVRKWALSVRLTAYRNDDRPKSPYLFTREHCLSALQVVPVEPVHLRGREVKIEEEKPYFRHQKNVSKELDALLKIWTGKSRKAE